MSTFKKAKVVMLPTNQKAKEGMIYSKPKINIFNKIASENHNNRVYDCNPQHLYVISDDEIKEGDWFYNIHSKIVGRAAFNFGKDELAKKIIATTDKTLSKTSRTEIPQPSQQFIQKFVEEYNKGNIITDVLVEYEIKSNAGLGHNEWVYLQHIEGKRYIPVKIKANTHQDTYELGKEDILEDFEIEINVKINPKDNTITIKKVKDIYTREEVDRMLDEQVSRTTAEMLEKFKDYKSKDEVIDLIIRAVSESHDWSNENNDIHSIGLIEKRFLNKWIEENL